MDAIEGSSKEKSSKGIFSRFKRKFKIGGANSDNYDFPMRTKQVEVLSVRKYDDDAPPKEDIWVKKMDGKGELKSKVDNTKTKPKAKQSPEPKKQDSDETKHGKSNISGSNTKYDGLSDTKPIVSGDKKSSESDNLNKHANLDKQEIVLKPRLKLSNQLEDSKGASIEKQQAALNHDKNIEMAMNCDSSRQQSHESPTVTVFPGKKINESTKLNESKTSEIQKDMLLGSCYTEIKPVKEVGTDVNRQARNSKCSVSELAEEDEELLIGTHKEFNLQNEESRESVSSDIHIVTHSQPDDLNVYDSASPLLKTKIAPPDVENIYDHVDVSSIKMKKQKLADLVHMYDTGGTASECKENLLDSKIEATSQNKQDLHSSAIHVDKSKHYGQSKDDGIPAVLSGNDAGEKPTMKTNIVVPHSSDERSVLSHSNTFTVINDDDDPGYARIGETNAHVVDCPKENQSATAQYDDQGARPKEYSSGEKIVQLGEPDGVDHQHGKALYGRQRRPREDVYEDCKPDLTCLHSKKENSANQSNVQSSAPFASDSNSVVKSMQPRRRRDPGYEDIDLLPNKMELDLKQDHESGTSIHDSNAGTSVGFPMGVRSKRLRRKPSYEECNPDLGTQEQSNDVSTATDSFQSSNQEYAKSEVTDKNDEWNAIYATTNKNKDIISKEVEEATALTRTGSDDDDNDSDFEYPPAPPVPNRNYPRTPSLIQRCGLTEESTKPKLKCNDILEKYEDDTVDCMTQDNFKECVQPRNCNPGSVSEKSIMAVANDDAQCSNRVSVSSSCEETGHCDKHLHTANCMCLRDTNDVKDIVNNIRVEISKNRNINASVKSAIKPENLESTHLSLQDIGLHSHMRHGCDKGEAGRENRNSDPEKCSTFPETKAVRRRSTGDSVHSPRRISNPLPVPPRVGRPGGSMRAQTLPLRASTGSYNAQSVDVIQSLLSLKDCGWYWGPLSYDDAEAKLDNKPDGSFLVRDSSDDRYILSLSFRALGKTEHTRIEHFKGLFSFYSQPITHEQTNIVDFIEVAMKHSRSGKFLYFIRPSSPGAPPVPVQLIYPISRFKMMMSLQHTSRYFILKLVRFDHIEKLPIPERLKGYLREQQYYAEYLDETVFQSDSDSDE